MLIYGVDLIEEHDRVLEHQARTGVPFERESIDRWLEVCKPGAVVIDVGAYTGLYSILAAKRGAYCYAFEPNPEVRERLEANLARNEVADRVSVFAAAAGAAHGRAALLTSGVPLTSGGRIHEAGHEVALEPLDAYWLSRLDAIKIDAEGYECEVLKGAARLIEEHRPLIITEALNDAALREQVDIMLWHNYAPRRVDEWNIAWQSLVF